MLSRYKKILIIGTGLGQLPLIEYVRSRNDLVSIGIDKNENSPGAHLVDEFICLDVKDIDSIREVALQNAVSAAVSMQSDVTIPAVAAVNDRLGLTGVNSNTASLCCNKEKTRNKLDQSDVSQPSYVEVKTLQEILLASEYIGFPCIVKATDSSGSRGVNKVNSSSGLEPAFYDAQAVSSSGIILIETFINGIEIGAQTFSQEGECLLCFVHNDELAVNSSLVPIGHSYPSKLKSFNVNKIRTEIIKTLDALGINDGPANVDIIFSDDGIPYIIEVGARAGATCLPELTHRHTGINWAEIIIENALGQKVNLQKIDNTPTAAFILESQYDGMLKAVVHNYDINQYLRYKPIIKIDVNIGDCVSVLRKGTDRVGSLVISADTVDEAEKIAHELRSKIMFEVI
jgi:biotin carboxylase